MQSSMKNYTYFFLQSVKNVNVMTTCEVAIKLFFKFLQGSNIYKWKCENNTPIHCNFHCFCYTGYHFAVVREIICIKTYNFRVKSGMYKRSNNIK
jgi:hypothetical protein